jgi:hypothetical protein
MRRSVLLLAATVLVEGCKHDKPCRPGTVLVTFEFADTRDHVDGLALQYSLDGATLTDLKSVSRPADGPASLEIEIANYDAHKTLDLRLAPLFAGRSAGDWQSQHVSLVPGCTSLSIPVNRPDAGVGDAGDGSAGDAGDGSAGDAGDGSAGDAVEPNPVCTLDQSNLDQCVLAE